MSIIDRNLLRQRLRYEEKKFVFKKIEILFLLLFSASTSTNPQLFCQGASDIEDD